MNILSQSQGYILIALFGAVLIGVTFLFSAGTRWQKTGVGFLVAGRHVPWTIGAFSIAASWIWAPALFVNVQKAYELGLPGIFWFTMPNILALVIFAFLAPRIRSKLPNGYTLPDWIKHRFPDPLVHRIYMIPYLWYQLMAIVVQIFVGGMMLNYLTGIPLNIVMGFLLLVGLSYTLISGLRASIVTDFIQMVFILLAIAIIIPWVISAAGVESIQAGLGGMANKRNIFDPEIAFSFGIVTSIGLIAGSISDQQYWQRSFAMKRSHLVPAFVIGGLLFGIVPIALSVLGFIAADPAMGISLPPGTGLPMIGIATVVKLLPAWAAILFVIMLLSGLCSTLDSALCAGSSLYAIDLARRSTEERAVLEKQRQSISLSENEQEIFSRMDVASTLRGRQGMLLLCIIGYISAIIVQHLFPLDRLWWIFNGVAACYVVPTVLSLYDDRLTSKGVIAGIVAASIGMIVFVYGNWIQNDLIVVLSALYMIVASLTCCFIFRSKVI